LKSQPCVFPQKLKIRITLDIVPIADSRPFISPETETGRTLNAILNFAYTIPQSQIQINAVAEGYDPTIGIMHEAHDGSSAFVVDLMEPERPAIDRKVLEFVKGHVFPADFVIRTDGVCRLNPEIARCVTGIGGGR
jgi:CRISPR-associated protein Cas1